MLRALLVTFALANTLCAEQTLYELLNVEQDATSAQIRTAYRKLASSSRGTPEQPQVEVCWVSLYCNIALSVFVEYVLRYTSAIFVNIS